MSTQCRGRLTGKSKKPDGKGTLEFIKDDPEKKRGNIFFVPVRCSSAAVEGAALCATCEAKRATTEAKECVKNGTYVANQETLFHGLVGETPPVWSHVYKSIWFNEFVKSPKHRVTRETFVIAEAGLAACPGGPEAELGKADCVAGSEVPMEKAKAEMPAEPVTEMSAETPVAKASAEPLATASAKESAPKPFMPPKKKVTIVETPTAIVAPVPAAEPPPEKPKPKRAPKKVGVKAAAAEPTGPPLGIIEKVAPSELPVVQIKVRKITIDDRVVYLASEKDKVYDLKFNYIGRYNRREDKIESKYPDSDRE